MHTRPERISFPQIESWSALSGVRLKSWQLAAITLMDDRFIEVESSPTTPAGDGGKAASEFMKRHAKPRKKPSG